jgi:hypothetical protein
VVQQGSVSVDVKRNIVNPISVAGDVRQEIQWMQTSGSFASAAEHAIFEQLYGVPAVSTERLLTLANSLGVRIFTIDRTNMHDILPQLDTFAVVKQNIAQSVDVGLVAVVPQRNVRFNEWLGMGWIVMDPNTGSAGYLIAGSLTAGGSTSSPANARSFAENMARVDAFVKLLSGLVGAAIGGTVFAKVGAASIAQALAGGGLILGVAGGFVLAVGIAMIAIAIAAAIYLLPKILATDFPQRRRWLASRRLFVPFA